MFRAISLLVLLAAAAVARGPVYVVLWFDTEDYIEPAADDAALRIATDLTRLGVRGTFKIVGEKARTLEARGRTDVLRALALHDIGYHANNHSIPPTPAVYLRQLSYLEGAEEFERREGPGVADLRRLFGIMPSCYGQPGSSWGPQSNLALRRLGIPVYLDEGTQVGVDHQPFWYSGLLYIFNMGPYQVRAPLEADASQAAALERFDRAAAELAERGGGVISSYYHPTEFVTTEFWDGVNFSGGANPERGEWRRPHRRAPEDSERCYGLLRAFVEHAKAVAGVRFVTARELLQLYGGPLPPHADRARLADFLCHRQTFLTTPDGALSAADALLELLGVEPMVVDGPVARRSSTVTANTIRRAVFERGKADAASFIRARRRLPDAVWFGSEQLSIGDFAATVAADNGTAGDVAVRRANPEFEKYVSTDAEGSFRWPIHPRGFRAPELLDLGRLQAWTLKPARLR